MGEIVQNKIYYTYRDVSILPGIVSDVEHRSQCYVMDEFGKLPLFTAPMDTVVGEKNFKLFEQNHINAILPRTEPLDTRIFYSKNEKWAAYSLSEFEEIFCNADKKLESPHKIYALIDIANGHMQKIKDLVKKARSIYYNDLIIMAGNIANPMAYESLASAGVNYIRCGIGSGCGCLSTSNTGIHMPMATLINDIAKLRKEIEDDYRTLPYIIADGGIRNYSDIIKAIALGADYVMVGSVFAKMLESAAPKKFSYEDGLKQVEIDIKDLKDFHYDGFNWYCKLGDKDIRLGACNATFYGMASRQGQIALNGTKTKTSEGIMKTLQVEYTMEGWTKNFIDYLRSAMSYVGAKTLDEFRNKSVLIVNSINAINAVNK